MLEGMISLHLTGQCDNRPARCDPTGSDKPPAGADAGIGLGFMEWSLSLSRSTKNFFCRRRPHQTASTGPAVLQSMVQGNPVPFKPLP